MRRGPEACVHVRTCVYVSIWGLGCNLNVLLFKKKMFYLTLLLMIFWLQVLFNETLLNECLPCAPLRSALHYILSQPC